MCISCSSTCGNSSIRATIGFIIAINADSAHWNHIRPGFQPGTRSENTAGLHEAQALVPCQRLTGLRKICDTSSVVIRVCMAASRTDLQSPHPVAQWRGQKNLGIRSPDSPSLLILHCSPQICSSCCPFLNPTRPCTAAQIRRPVMLRRRLHCSLLAKLAKSRTQML